jgi:hypothetical protein
MSSRLHYSLTLESLIACTLLVNACVLHIGGFDEPGLRAKLIDAETKLPIQGAVVRGYYAFAEGSIGGGEKITSILHVFEAESDSNGVFEVKPFKDESWIKRGEPRQRFPAISIYKDGYQVFTVNLKSMSGWIPFSDKAAQPVNRENVLDWTADAHNMKPAKTEEERYNALLYSNDAYAEIGPCGWEQHVRLLKAQHRAIMAWVQRNVPPEHIGKNGYAKSGYWLPMKLMGGLWINPGRVDRLREASTQGKLDPKCANPNDVFGKD